AGSCTWIEAKEHLGYHFSAERQNVAFQFTIDDLGIHVWAQWDGPQDDIILMVSLMNVLTELQCLYPVPDDVIIIGLTEQGVVWRIGVLPGSAIQNMDIGQLTIMY
ncbi:MAG TPA: hypothetical protein VFF78_01950, partial [Anaerolineaceae bacterium]|nr:hypothetical protein [Anaerolineaceae bacterium]